MLSLKMEEIHHNFVIHFQRMSSLRTGAIFPPLLHNSKHKRILNTNMFNYKNYYLHFWFKSFKFLLMFIAISFISRYFRLVSLFIFSRSLQSSLVALKETEDVMFLRSVIDHWNVESWAKWQFQAGPRECQSSRPLLIYDIHTQPVYSECLSRNSGNNQQTI